MFVSPEETCLQITDALSYLENLGLVHGGVSSHSVVMTTVNVAKLGLMERTVRAGEIPPAPPEFLFNWTSPEILLLEDEVAARQDDVFGLCCVLWELCSRTLPWDGYTPDQIFQAVREGATTAHYKGGINEAQSKISRASGN